MNKAKQLFDADFIRRRYGKKILKRLPEFLSIDSLEVVEHKSHVWETTYHVVIEYRIAFRAKAGGNKTLSVFCSAHSSEPRKNVYESLKFLWNNGFNGNSGNILTVPHPLFYSNYFRGTFYVGAEGRNLHQYIREGRLDQVEKIIVNTAAWFAKLHAMPIAGARNFSRDNSRIKTVRPGMKTIFARLEDQHSQLYGRFKKAFESINDREKEFMAGTKERWLVHGDAHPENIIEMPDGKICVIDFTDLCLADFARDLGTFLQQLDMKIDRRLGNPEFAAKMKKVFLDNYLENAKIKLDEGLKQRIDAYYDWTVLRNVAFFLTKHNPLPDRAEQLLNSLHIE